jgi:hypothetical protein
MVALMTFLEGASRPAEVPEPVRTRLESPTPSQLPALTVYQGREVVDPMRDEQDGRSSRGAIVRRALEVRIEAVVKAVLGTPADAVADPLLAWATNAVAEAGRLETVAAPRGLADQAADEVGTTFEYEQGEYSFCRATLTVRFRYQSSSTDAESLT